MIKPLSERAEDIFYSALKIESAEEREKLLERECRGDRELRSLVVELLDSQSNATKFFEDDVIARLPLAALEKSFRETPGLPAAGMVSGEDELPGKSVGPYRLMERLGEGGCGVVYLAEQESPVRRKVAFKIIKLGMDTKSVIARFEAERQALAIMDHPNIARVLDAGATDTGRPYFVMELVRGVKITEYCDQNELDTRERLRLFIIVCQAIQHAHQKGVIHRDIKPSNILITIIDGVPVPKVIDFGIAKAIEGRLTDNTIFTAYEQFIGTPAYMSPEQAVMSGVDVDTRSDIYSLGVLLCELLTGRPPFETKELLDKGIDGLRKTLRDEEPKRPSVLVTTMHGSALTQLARNHHAEPVKLISTLRGDLDWIVIKALEKDRSRRYETANGLAMDVRRYLDNEPVVARPPSRFYRLQKLVRRNKGTFVFGTLVAMVLVGWLGTSTWLLQKERDERRRAVASEQQEMRLRLEAENREQIAEAAFGISQNRMAEADAMVSKVSVVKPSLETESVLRALGQWHALHLRWDLAAERFNLLLDADQKDNSMAITTDLLMAGPIQIERGDIGGYERFRRVAVSRFLPTTDPVSAERTLKISLLLPADGEMMKSMETLSVTAAKTVNRRGLPENGMVAWRCMSLALMAYRQGAYADAKAWAEQSLSYQTPDFPNHCRDATVYIIEAMVDYKSGAKDMAKAELAKGRDLVQAEFSKTELEEGNGWAGFWYDWLFARILLGEAETLTGGGHGDRGAALREKTGGINRNQNNPRGSSVIFFKNYGANGPLNSHV